MSNDRLEIIILKNLLNNETYCRKVLPFLKGEYFTENIERVIFEQISFFIIKYNNLPTKEALIIQLSEDKNLTTTDYQRALELVNELADRVYCAPDEQWILDTTERFCQEKAIYNAVLGSIKILDNQDKKQDKGVIPKLLSDALAVSFDPNVGHNYIEDSDKRYDQYHCKQEKIPFDLALFNKITSGGLERKTLNIVMAGTAVGKTLAMVHFAASYLVSGKNVLYITLEMSEQKIAERIDANLLNVNIKELVDLPKDIYDKKVARVKEKTTGRLIIKEYPTASASTIHFRHLLHELNLKKSFVPDVIFIDYLNIATSSRIKPGSNANSYTYVKSIAEELRGMAVECNVPIISATQVNRAGFTSSDIGLEDTSESFGLPATADFMFALTSNEELESLNQIVVKQLKNRYNDVSMYRRFLVGIDRSKMRLYDLDDSAQKNLHEHLTGEKDATEDTPQFDKSKFGKGMKAERLNPNKFKQIKFDTAKKPDDEDDKF